MSEFKLCYIEPNEKVAWFTTAELKDQGGEDWHKHRSSAGRGLPYEWRESDGVPKYELYRLMFDAGNLEMPPESYSARRINAGAAAWLSTTPWSDVDPVVISAGVSIEEFKRLVRLTGGAVFVEDTPTTTGAAPEAPTFATVLDVSRQLTRMLEELDTTTRIHVNATLMANGAHPYKR